MTSCMLATFANVVGVTLEAREASTQSVAADSVGSAHDVRAWRHGRLTGRGIVQAGLGGRLHAHLEWIADEAVLTATVEASRGVQADGIHAACIADALVDIDTLDVRIALVSNGAHAVHAIHTLATLGISAAPRCGAVGLLVLL